ncbi:hypothetical protein [Microbacterium terricola]|nr:hypothetical protein [Microbacterium terricola]UYK40070.1 hypothetical protein OAU46_15500 [Microbacterium terricola]
MADTVSPPGGVMVRARVAFTAFESPDDPLKLAWRRFRDPLVPLAGAQRVREAAEHVASAPAGPRSGLWRLMASNNREIGRSYHLYRSFERARTHVEQLQAAPDALEVEMLTAPGGSARAWILTAHGMPVMTCSRWYASSSSGAEAAALALAALPGAVLSPAADRCGPSGRFVRRTPRSDSADGW